MFVKAGISANVHKRLRSYHTHCPIPFSVGFRMHFLTTERAKDLENTVLFDRELKDYKPKPESEWFIVMAGPEQHVLFIGDLLACIYLYRFRDPALWINRPEWVIVPDSERVAEIPGADAQYLCGPETAKDLAHFEDEARKELLLRARAEEQAEALGRLIYPELDQ
jgi:hypothetical protein